MTSAREKRPARVSGKGFFEIEGLQLEWKRWGSRRTSNERPTVVLLHEGLGCVERWRDFPAELAGTTGLDVLAYSRHGYGGSTPLVQPRTIRYMHHEALVVLPAVLHQSAVGRHLLVGHSDGASIALINQGSRRGSAEALVAIAPHIHVEEIAVHHIRLMRDDAESTDLLERLGRYHTDAEATFRGWNDVWLSDDFRSWNIESSLPGITCPVLALQGTDDPYATMAMLDGIVAGVGGPVRTDLIPDAGHIPHVDAPEATLAVVADFIDEVVSLQRST